MSFDFNQLLSSILPLKSITSMLNLLPPDQLWFSEKGNNIQLTSLRRIEKLTHIKWTEHILTDFLTLKKLTSWFDKDCSRLENPIIDFSHFQQSCAIRWLDQEIGWVLTLRAGQTLQPGFLCLYAGLLKQIPLLGEANYTEREYFFDLFRTEKENYIIDAKHKGNLSRFLPFLLNETQLDNFKIDASIKDNIALANLQFKFIHINGMNLPCVYAPKTITAPPNQEILLGLNYSIPYLCKMYQCKKSFKFINKNTLTMIPTSLYEPKVIQVHLRGLSYSFPMLRLRIMASEYLSSLQHETIGYDDQTNEYYKVIVNDDEIYAALLENPHAEEIMVTPRIIKNKSPGNL